MAQKRVNSKVAAENEQKEQRKNNNNNNDQPDNFGRFGANTQRTNIS